MIKKLSNAVKIFTLIPAFIIFTLALSACSASEPPLAIELSADGNNANIAEGTVSIAQGADLQFAATLRQANETISGTTFEWELVGNTGSSARSEVMATSSETGATVDNGLVTIPLEIPAAANSLRLNVTTTHGGQVVSTHAVINVTASMPAINITPSPATITTTTRVEASLAGGLVMMGDFNWELRCAGNGELVPEALATVTASGLNNSSALVTIVDRDSLRQISEALRLNVTASGATAHSVLINLAMPLIRIRGSETLNPVTIEATTATATVVASLASGFTILGNFEWELVYAGSGAPVPASVATVSPSGNNASSATVRIVDRNLLLRTSGALRLNVTAPRAAPNHVLINVAMPQIQIGDSAEPDPVPIAIAATETTATVTASLADGFTMDADNNFEWELVYYNNGVAVPAAVATVTPSSANNSSATVTIVNRALLASGRLRLNVAADRAMPNHVVIDVVIPQIYIENLQPPSITIAPGATNATVTASFPLPTGVTANFNWTLVYANGLAVPTGAATVTVTPLSANSSSATVTIVNRALLVSGALRLNVTAAGAIANHVLIDVQMPQIYINDSANPQRIPIPVGVDEPAPIVARLSVGEPAPATNFNWTLVYANGAPVPEDVATVTVTPLPEDVVTVTPSSANNSSATVTIVNRALLTSGLLRLNVTAAGAIANHVLIDVTIPPCALSALEWCRAHDTFEDPDPDTDTVWRVLLPDDGNGHALIITEYVHILGRRYHSSIGFTPFQSADAILNVRQWWADANVIGPTLRARAVDYEFQNASGGSIPRTSTNVGAGIEVNRVVDSGNGVAGAVSVDANVPRGRTRANPGSNLAPEPFILSTSEANHYFSGATGPQGRQARRVNGGGAIWWLRSPGFMTTASDNRHAAVLNNGFVGAGSASANWESVGHRPALWITNELFGSRSNR